MVNSRSKGKRGELELAKALEAVFGVECRRGQQYSGLGGDDVVGLPGIHVECKRTETLRLFDAMAQAINDAGETEVPLLCHRRNNEEWVAIVPLSDLPELARRVVKILENKPCNSK